MGYFVDRLKRPYDHHVMIEAYIRAQRSDFVHDDFSNYYAGLLQVLQKCFGVLMSREGAACGRASLWHLFDSTVGSLLQITNPWSGYLEAGLLYRTLDDCGELGKAVHRASALIGEANTASRTAHQEMLCALFQAMFGECRRVVTSDELLQAGFDDSKEPDIASYYDCI